MKRKTFYGPAITSALILWFLKLFFLKKNTFQGALIGYNVVETYYRNDPTFSRFVFQQKIKDGSKANDDYDLMIWAIDNKGAAMNTEVIPIEPLTDRPLPKNKKVNFANIVLSRKDLDYLYISPTSKGELKLYPEEYKDTNYVSYSAETINSPLRVVKLNPSPPASQPSST